jgi:hypothetical protein
MNEDLFEDVTKEFLEELLADRLEDWSQAKAYGEFLTSRYPELLIGHLILCRAYRHMGDLPCALEELRDCKSIISKVDFFEQEFIPEFTEEERKLLTQTG